jgi:hypothetical protein
LPLIIDFVAVKQLILANAILNMTACILLDVFFKKAVIFGRTLTAAKGILFGVIGPVHELHMHRDRQVS